MEETQQPKREAFAFLWTFKDAMSDLEEDEKLELYEAITDFAFFDIEPVFTSRVARAVFKSIRINLQRAKDRYDRCKKNGSKGAEFGKLGGRPKKQEQTVETPTITPIITPKETPKKPLNVNDNVNVNVNDNVEKKEKRSPRFVAPSLEEVKIFFEKNNFTSNPESFFDYYDANGWTQGKGKQIKKWEAAARNWERRQSEFAPMKTERKEKALSTSQRSNEPDYSITSFDDVKTTTDADYYEEVDAFISKNR